MQCNVILDENNEIIYHHPSGFFKPIGVFSTDFHLRYTSQYLNTTSHYAIYLTQTVAGTATSTLSSLLPSSPSEFSATC